MSTVKQYPISEFRPLNEAHLEQVWLWRNQPDIRRNMHKDMPISWHEHLAWFDSLQGDLSRRFFLFYQNGRPIGVLNFSRLDQQTLEWGCYLGEDNVWPGTGLLLEIAALDYASSQSGVQRLYAEVLSFNHSVLKMHGLFGYQPMEDKPGGTRDNIEYVVKTFHYPLANWPQNRSTVLQRLPKQIGAAARYIQFS